MREKNADFIGRDFLGKGNDGSFLEKKKRWGDPQQNVEMRKKGSTARSGGEKRRSVSRRGAAGYT